MKFITPNNKTFKEIHYSILDRNSFVFHVKAPHSVFIALTNVHGITDTLTYELGIGIEDNTKTVLRVGACRVKTTRQM